MEAFAGKADRPKPGCEGELRRYTRYQPVRDLQSQPEADYYSRRPAVHAAGCASAESELHFVSLRRSHRRSDLQRSPIGCGKRSEEHTSELQSHSDLVCRLLLEKKKIVQLGQRPTRIL